MRERPFVWFRMNLPGKQAIVEDMMMNPQMLFLTVFGDFCIISASFLQNGRKQLRFQNGDAILNSNCFEKMEYRRMTTPILRLKNWFAICVLLGALTMLFGDVRVQAADKDEEVATLYEEYEMRFAQITTLKELQNSDYRIVEKHVFDLPLVTKMTGPDGEETDTEVLRPKQFFQMDAEDALMLQVVPTVRFFTALDEKIHRAAVFLADRDGRIVYKTNRLECNYTVLGQLEQPITDMISVAFQDLNQDGLCDITLIAGCVVRTGEGEEKSYRIGEVLFQTGDPDGQISFVRDWRINDKINRFGMNKNAKCIRSFVRDERSAEFLYTATTEAELLQHGFVVAKEQSYVRNYEKLGKLKVLPGVFSLADYDIFMIYMINESGDIVWSFQPMGEYDNLYALKGISGRDLDGDGMKDLLVVARYSRENENGDLIVEGKFSIYYQRTGGFEEDTEFEKENPYRAEETVGELVDRIHGYWGWQNSEALLSEDKRDK